LYAFFQIFKESLELHAKELRLKPFEHDIPFKIDYDEATLTQNKIKVVGIIKERFL